MASIDGYLSQIKTAIYGEDVRDSIYNSIKAINNENEGIMSSAESAINSYIDNIKIYNYVNELPEIGDEQTLYVLQDALQYINAWEPVSNSDDDIIQYAATENNQFNDWPNANVEWFQSVNLSNSDKKAPVAGLIFKITDYEQEEADISNPKYALLILECIVKTQTSISAPLACAATSFPITYPKRDDEWLIDISSINWIYSSHKIYNTNYFAQFLDIRCSEYIYDDVNDTWVYNNTYTKLNIQKQNLALQDITSIEIDTSYQDGYGYGLIAVQRVSTPYGYYYCANTKLANISSANVRIYVYDHYAIDTEWKLNNPYQELVDNNYSGAMYVWSNQLKRYLALRTAEEAIPKEFEVNLEYKEISGNYEWAFDKTYEEIDAFARVDGAVDRKKRFVGSRIHPGPGRYGYLLNWAYSQAYSAGQTNKYFFEYDGTTAYTPHTSVSTVVYSIDENNNIEQVTS